MCEWSKWGDTRIDPCMRNIIQELDVLYQIANKKGIKVVACCCGHGKYPMTIVISNGKINWELFTNKIIPRTRRFYKRDKQGRYYIPEVGNE